ncbi:MAG: hypothetical protein DRN66_02360 [Candidatus Nanohalarchaeota archaeon]|nr:MAG: hypothetical protein DRN66_02360 [Candidatus Nanohaloarchaeota archaeon]
MDYLIAVFNKYDIRGSYPDEIDDEFSYKIGRTAGTYCKENFENHLIAVGMDTRKSSKTIKENLIDGLNSAGVDVIDIGKATTDKTALAGNYYNCAFSIMVTASHHPIDHNGFKFMYEKGNGFSNKEMEKIKKIFIGDEFISGKGNRTDKTEEFDKIYEQKIESALEKYIDTGKLKGLNVVADCCNSFASRHLINILEKYKCNVVRVNCKIKSDDASFEPKPTEKNRQNIADMVKKTKADIGIGVDLDADRIFAFDSTGRWIDGHEIFCLLSETIGSKKIVASVDTSSMLQEHMRDAKVIRTKIGDIFVSEKAIEMDADFSGEPNGHYAFPKFCKYNSGIFSGLMLCSIAKEIPKMRKNLPKYHNISKTITHKSHREKEEAMTKIKAKAREKYEVVSELCGIKFRYNDTVFLIRASGTSPVIRVMAENKDKKKLQEDKEILLDQLFNTC